MKVVYILRSVACTLCLLVAMPGGYGSKAPHFIRCEPHLGSVKMKGGNQYIGQALDTLNEQLVFCDNLLGEITLALDRIKSFQPEDTTSVYRLTLQSGSLITGTLVGRTPGFILLQSTGFGEVSIPSAHILKIESLGSRQPFPDKHPYPNPNYTRYLFAPSALPMKKGEWYYQNAYVLANSGNMGVTNSLTLGGGVILPLAAYITPKYGVKVVKNVYCAAGLFYSLLPAFNDEQAVHHLALGYGLLTYGNYDHNLTLGFGHGYAGSDWLHAPIATFNGMTRISRRVMLITENWLIRYKTADFPETIYGNEFLFSYGARFIWPRLAVDVAFYNNAYIQEFLPIGVPYIDFVLKF